MHVGRMWADVVGGRGRMWVDTGGYRAEVGEPDGVPLTVASVTLGASERSCARIWRAPASLVSRSPRARRGMALYGNAVRPGCAWSRPPSSALRWRYAAFGRVVQILILGPIWAPCCDRAPGRIWDSVDQHRPGARRTSMGLNSRLLMRASQRGGGIAVLSPEETRLLSRRDRLPLGFLERSGAKHDNAQRDEPDDLEKAEDVDGVQQRRND